MTFDCKADEYEALARQLHDAIKGGQSIEDTAKALRLLAIPVSDIGKAVTPCWFCGRGFTDDYLIAGYDTFEEQRLACLDCDRAIHALRDKGWLPVSPKEPEPDQDALARGLEYLATFDHAEGKHEDEAKKIAAAKALRADQPPSKGSEAGMRAGAK